jgi:hypothetical protein
MVLYECQTLAFRDGRIKCSRLSNISASIVVSIFKANVLVGHVWKPCIRQAVEPVGYDRSDWQSRGCYPIGDEHVVEEKEVTKFYFLGKW